MNTTNYRYNGGEIKITEIRWTDGITSLKAVVWTPNGKSYSDTFETETGAKEWGKNLINQNRRIA